VPDRGLAVQPPGEPSQLGGERHADRHRGAMPEPVALDLFDCVPERVSVVEHLPADPAGSPGCAGALVRVRADHCGLDRDRALDQLAGVRPGRVGRGCWIGLDQVENHRIGDEPGLDDLGKPGHIVGARNRLQHGQISDHSGRLVERADQVLPLGDVDRGLAADRRVHHAEQRGGNVHDRDAAQPGRGDEPGQVGRRAAADRDQRVGPSEPVLGECRPAPAGNRQPLGWFAVRQLDRVHLIAAAGQVLSDHGGGAAQHLRMQHRDPHRLGR
jgi:hypothetical protein